MHRSTLLVAVVGLVGIGYLYVDNRDLRAELAELRAAETQSRDAWGRSEAGSGGDRIAALASQQASKTVVPGAVPTLAGEVKESRLDRRQRRLEQFAQMFGRLPGETDEEYRARVMPLANVWIERSRRRVDDMRRMVEEKAGISAEQRQKIDAALAPAYEEFLAHTNAAIRDGQLSPYDFSVTGMLEYAGGLGPLLSQTEGKVNQVLSPEQQKVIAASGFEWGEYMWAYAPWDRVTPPPPPGQ